MAFQPTCMLVVTRWPSSRSMRLCKLRVPVQEFFTASQPLASAAAKRCRSTSMSECKKNGMTNVYLHDLALIACRRLRLHQAGKSRPWTNTSLGGNFLAANFQAIGPYEIP